MDKCSPASNSTDREDSFSGNNANQSVIDRILVSDIGNAGKSVPYGFQRHTRPAITELALAIWVFTLLCEEIRQVIY